MKTIGLVLLAMVFIATMAMATEQCPPPPCPECQPVQVTCECNCSSETIFPGLWRVFVVNHWECGKMVVYNIGFTIDGELFMGKPKNAKKLEEGEVCK